MGFADAALGAALDALAPLEAAVADEIALIELLRDLGWMLPDGDVDMSLLTSVSAIADDIESAATALEAYRADGGEDDEALATLGETVVGLLVDIAALASKPLPTALPEPLSTQAFWDAMASELPGYLLADYIRRRLPPLYAVLHVTGIIDKVQPVQDPNRADDQLVDVLRWDRLATLFTDPKDLIVDVYGWGGALKYQDLLDRMRDVIVVMGAVAIEVNPGQARLDKQYGAGTTLAATVPMLRVPLFVGDPMDDPYLEAGVDALPVPTGPGSATPVGLLVSPYATGALTASIPLTNSLTLLFSGTVDGSGAIGVIVRPDDVSLWLDAGAVTTDLSGKVTWAPAQPLVLLGDPSKTGVSIAGAEFGVELLLSGTTLDEARLRLGIVDLHAHVDFGEGDSFIAQLASGVVIDAVLTAALIWSTKSGVSFEGSPRIEISIPLNLTLGPIELQTLTVGAGIEQGDITLMGAIDAAAEIGPVQAAVTKVGLKMVLEPSDQGSFGGLQPSFRFKPPDGLGLSVEAGPVGGGGFIQFDEDKQEYAGMLELDLEICDLTAIGLLTTLMPDGSKGFSLLVIIAAEFSPIQLGYGFTLNGVGGLVGINRGMNVDFLRSGLKDGTLDSIRFPHDVVANAPKIISDLRQAFPVQENEYVFGPMVAIGWGESIIELQLGLVLQLPSPLRLVIVGALIVALPEPDPEIAILLIKLELLGVIDFDKGEVSFDGALVDSRVAVFTITGQMAMRASFGANPTFMLSAGGYHPKFQPPPSFPTLERMAISLCTGDNPRLRLEAYFAVTANTLQIGAHLEVYAEKDLGFIGDFELHGYLGFDALLRFSPFSFIVEISGGLTIKRNGDCFLGVTFDLTLSGPQPWHACGTATFSVLGCSASVGFDLTMGDPPPPAPLPPIDPLGLLKAALEDIRSWAAGTPSAPQNLVSLRAQPAGDDRVLVHPLGTMTVRQRVVPLNFAIQQYGHQPLSGTLRTFTIDSVKAGNQTLAQDDVRDHFAPGDFLKLTDDQKLARPSFEELNAGVTMGSAPIAAGARAQTNFAYKQYILTDAPNQVADHHLSPADLQALSATGPAGRAPDRTTGAARYAGDNQPVTVTDAPYAVSRKDTLGAAAGVEQTGPTYAEAEAARQQAGDAGDLQVVAAHEVGV